MGLFSHSTNHSGKILFGCKASLTHWWSPVSCFFDACFHAAHTHSSINKTTRRHLAPVSSAPSSLLPLGKPSHHLIIRQTKSPTSRDLLLPPLPELGYFHSIHRQAHPAALRLSCEIGGRFFSTLTCVCRVSAPRGAHNEYPRFATCPSHSRSDRFARASRW